MQDLTFLMLYTVFDADAVSFFLKLRNTISQLRLVFIHDRLCDHIKAIVHQLILGLIT